MQESYADVMKARGAGGEAAPRPRKKKKNGPESAVISEMIRDEQVRRAFMKASRQKRRKPDRYPRVRHASMKDTEKYLRELLERTGEPEFPPEVFCAVAEARRAAALESINEHLGGSVY